jgi:hemolysin activation/secretion protein
VRRGQVYAGSVGVDFGVRSILNGPDEFENSRYNAHPDYFYLRLGFSANQPLPVGLSLLERASGQWADSALVNNEQFSLGGVDTVRGYLEAETLGDSGLAGSLELHSPPLGAIAGAVLSPLYGYVFVDGGVATLVDPLPAQQRNLTLWSTGVGVRLDDVKGASGSVDYAIPQRNGVRTRKDDGRVDLLLRYAF